MNQPQSELAKKLSIAVQALQTATVRNDGPCQHLAAESINAVIGEIDAMNLEILELKQAKAAKEVEDLTKQKETLEAELEDLKCNAPSNF
jgi:FtsZ-binding cell division protein ZapB